AGAARARAHHGRIAAARGRAGIEAKRRLRAVGNRNVATLATVAVAVGVTETETDAAGAARVVQAGVAGRARVGGCGGGTGLPGRTGAGWNALAGVDRVGDVAPIAARTARVAYRIADHGRGHRRHAGLGHSVDHRIRHDHGVRHPAAATYP